MTRFFALFEGFIAIKMIFLISMGAYFLDGVFMPRADRMLQLDQSKIDLIEKNLKSSVEYLAQELGHRNVLNYKELLKSANYIKSEFDQYSYEAYHERYTVVKRRGYELYGSAKMKDILEVSNVVALKKGLLPKTILIGAHYDSVIGSPGADDNASGVAVLLELSRLLAPIKLDCTLKFVAFVNEEPPYFQTKEMGSYVSAELSHRRGEEIIAMISLESLGFYSEEKKSQKYPL
ncbi:M28 family peptidase, partial [bacterium]|nr:M28 family peptidase [bacterium]